MINGADTADMCVPAGMHCATCVHGSGSALMSASMTLS